MLFSSLIFLFLFLPAVLLVYYAVLRKRTSRNLLLTFASLCFYAWGEPRFVFVMIACVLLNYIWGLLVQYLKKQNYRTGARWILALAAATNISLLGVYKYAGFLVKNLNLLGAGLPVPQIALPIGISFFTFQAMSYVFDVYKEGIPAQKNPLDLMLYVSFFPQLIAGPIVRYETVANQIHGRKETFDSFASGTRRFVEGLAKKVLLSNQLALVADRTFNMADYSQLSASLAWLGAVCYALQIYYDFSGYSDMAIGLGRMFGFSFLENFNYPYITKSVSEFWRRWHISLGSWFRDYVYFPLGGSRVKSKGRLVFNLFVVWVLTGVWHGASWNFVAWGFLYFCWIAFERLTGIPGRFQTSAGRILYRLVTLLVILLGWVLFRAEGLGSAVQYLLCMLGGNRCAEGNLLSLTLLRENAIFLLAAVVLAMPTVPFLAEKAINCPKLGERLRDRLLIAGYAAYGIWLLVLFATVIAYLAKGSYNPFIYFNF